MHKKLYSLLLFIGLSAAAFAQQIQTPSQFLGYKLGSQFTLHHHIVDYVKYLAGVSKNMKLVQYGTTNEGRPLYLAFIASDENIGRLEEIRQNNLKLAGIAPGAGSTTSPAVVWLSYNVHGNEPASSESAMQTLYDLVNPANTQVAAWLKNLVVIVDPCLNPDGRDRYINFYNGVKGSVPDAYNQAREHIEGWPSGRVNHYYFDLNRDWAWQTQKEVQQRLVYYNQWLPQIHVDYHEQGYNAPYYFAPAAEPMHKDITPWQREFQTMIGKNNAKYFDAKGWTYFTKEEFDLLYPSYGDTYPIYNGSIGMTFEQGGISAGLAVVTRSGDTLTLADRIEHHHTTALSTLEMASAHAGKLLTEYKKFFDNNRATPPGEFKTYVVKNDNEDKMGKLATLLDKNGITYSFAINKEASGVNYFDGKTESFHIATNDMVINAAQPKAVLLNLLMERKTFMTDSNTYDITAWSLPYAYGLKTYGLAAPITGEQVHHVFATGPAKPVAGPAYAYALAWRSGGDVTFLADLMKSHIKSRYVETPFEAAGKKFDAGTVVITRAGNDKADFDKTVNDIASRDNISLTTLSTGFAEKGRDIGSGDVHFIKAPRVMLLTGEGTNFEAVGEVWHYFDQEIKYPCTLVRLSDLGRVKLSDFDVIVMPDGNYNDPPLEKLVTWIRDGGKLIAMGDAVSALSGRNNFSIKKKEDKKDDGKNKYAALKTFGERNNESTKNGIPGAIYKVNIDNTHPLGFGYPKFYYSLKLDDNVYDFLGDDGWNVGTIKKDAYTAGFVGQKTKEKLVDGLLFGVQNLGRGSVVYLADDPLFRSFWEGGKLLFGNAVFMVGN